MYAAGFNDDYYSQTAHSCGERILKFVSISHCHGQEYIGILSLTLISDLDLLYLVITQKQTSETYSSLPKLCKTEIGLTYFVSHSTL